MRRLPLLALLLLTTVWACSSTPDDADCSGGVGLDEDGDTYRTCGLAALIDCDDSDPAVHPEAEETCGDSVDNDCNGTADDLDADGDGFISSECFGPDCDDADDQAYPGRPESCDGADNNCNGIIDDGFDADDDGWTSCAGDCVNSDALINPDAEELCDGIDNNCNCLDTPTDSNGDGTFCGPGDLDVDEAFDSDGDGFIDARNPLCVDIYGPNADFSASGDCNDDDAAIFPQAYEDPTDGVDNDCDGEIDES